MDVSILGLGRHAPITRFTACTGMPGSPRKLDVVLDVARADN